MRRTDKNIIKETRNPMGSPQRVSSFMGVMSKYHTVFKVTNNETGEYVIYKYTSDRKNDLPYNIHNRLPQRLHKTFTKDNIQVDILLSTQDKDLAYSRHRQLQNYADPLCQNKKIGYPTGKKRRSGLKRKCGPKSEEWKRNSSIAHKNSPKSQAAIKKARLASPMNKKGRPGLNQAPP